MAGLSGSGLETLTREQILEAVLDRVEGAFPNADVRRNPGVRVLAESIADHVSRLHTTARDLYDAMGPDASGILLDRVAALTGTIRRAATRSRVTVEVTLEGGTTLPAGSQAHVNGSPDAVFRTLEDVTNTDTEAPATLPVVMESVDTGPIPAEADSLTEIVTSVTGWTSINNPEAATLGREAADDAELHQQRRVELASGGQRTTAAIRSNVAAIDGVQDVDVRENTSERVDADGRPPKSIEVIVFDGDPPDPTLDDEIAQAIADTKGEGIEAHGVGESGTATDGDGVEYAVPFTRVNVIKPAVVVSGVKLKPNAPADWKDQVKATIVERAKDFEVGELAHVSNLYCIAKFPWFVHLASLTLDGGTEAGGAYDEIVRINGADVTVTEAP